VRRVPALLLLVALACGDQENNIAHETPSTPPQQGKGGSHGQPRRDESPPPPDSGGDFCPQSISWRVAEQYAGQVQRIEGAVAGTVYAHDSNGQPTFLNVGKDYPNPRRFTIVIWGDDRKNFPFRPEQRYQRATVCVRGEISLFNGVPQVFADGPADIETTSTGSAPEDQARDIAERFNQAWVSDHRTAALAVGSRRAVNDMFSIPPADRMNTVLQSCFLNREAFGSGAYQCAYLLEPQDIHVYSLILTEHFGEYRVDTVIFHAD
jgi:hypothetical protein